MRVLLAPPRMRCATNIFFGTFLGVNAKAEAIFNALSAYLVSNDIPFAYIIEYTNDGAAAMVGRHSGFTSRLRSMAPQIITI